MCALERERKKGKREKKTGGSNCKKERQVTVSGERKNVSMANLLCITFCLLPKYCNVLIFNSGKKKFTNTNYIHKEMKLGKC